MIANEIIFNECLTDEEINKIKELFFMRDKNLCLGKVVKKVLLNEWNIPFNTRFINNNKILYFNTKIDCPNIVIMCKFFKKLEDIVGNKVINCGYNVNHDNDFITVYRYNGKLNRIDTIDLFVD